jgi:succinate dehydrogenase hydrophobic anchor subunit
MKEIMKAAMAFGQLLEQSLLAMITGLALILLCMWFMFFVLLSQKII